MRWPLVNPDPFLTAITPCLRWLFTRWAFAMWAVIVLLALYHAAAKWPRIVASSSALVVLGNAWWLTACWVVLKCLHEMAHAVVCKKYGCSVRGAGIILVLLRRSRTSMASSWRCRSNGADASRSRALHNCSSPPRPCDGPHRAGVVNHVCLNVAIMASVTAPLPPTR
jgi:hypothetical protein